MQVSHEQISAALSSSLMAQGFPDVSIRLMAVESPRPWGVTTNACFMLGKQAAAESIALAVDGLSKKDARQKSGELAKIAGEKLAAAIADELSEQISVLPFVSSVEAEGAYINFYYDRTALAAQVIARVLDENQVFGSGEPTNRRIMVEYAQPNTHKDFHVGHLRNASIGQAIANLLEFAGNTVLKATYIGDVGAHVAKAIWGHSHRELPQYSHHFEKANNLADGIDRLAYWGECYQGANLLAGADEGQIKSQLQEWLQAWEAGDNEARSIWAESRDECDTAFREIFKTLRIEFDSECWFYESIVDDSKLGQHTSAELKNRGIAVIDDSDEYKGALYVDFEQHAPSSVFSDSERKKIGKLGKMTILRSDNTSLYQTKELGLAKHKFDNFNIDESLYVVGAEQKLYFEQVFAILRLWGFPNAENCHHIAYALVVLPEGKMSSREGTIVSYRELRDEALNRAREITVEKGVAGNVDQTAVDIAIAAVKFAMLKVTGSQQIVFDFEESLSFSGRAAPYLQYAYARAGKLVDEQTEFLKADTIPDHELHDSEIELARQLSQFPSSCLDAAAHCEPATVCTYLYTLANCFSAFYRDCRVLDASEPQRVFRVNLTRAFRKVINTGFRLLALPLPEEM